MVMVKMEQFLIFFQTMMVQSLLKFICCRFPTTFPFFFFNYHLNSYPLECYRQFNLRRFVLVEKISQVLLQSCNPNNAIAVYNAICNLVPSGFPLKVSTQLVMYGNNFLVGHNTTQNFNQQFFDINTSSMINEL